jgi:hypothetical protein
MPSQLTSSEKSQKTQTILAAGTLWEVKESSKSLKNMEKTNIENANNIKQTNAALNDIKADIKAVNMAIKEQTRLAEEGTEIAKESLMVQKFEALKQDEDRIKSKEKETTKNNVEQQSKYRRDAFFHLKQELDELESSEASNLEKYFSIASINAMFKEYKFSTKLTDDLFEKQLIHDSLIKVKELNKIVSIFSSQEKSDFNAITKIMEHDEESEIIELKKERNRLSNNYEKEIDILKKSQDFGYILKTYSRIIKKLK